MHDAWIIDGHISIVTNVVQWSLHSQRTAYPHLLFYGLSIIVRTR